MVIKFLNGDYSLGIRLLKAKIQMVSLERGRFIQAWLKLKSIIVLAKQNLYVIYVI